MPPNFNPNPNPTNFNQNVVGQPNVAPIAGISPANQPINQQQNKLQPQNPLTQKLPFKKAYYKTLAKGSLITCKYLYWKHDPNPLILVTDVTPEYIRGVNLHYLTFKYVRSLLQTYCGKLQFSYRFIMHDSYIVNSFRTYKKIGISNISVLDCGVINSQLNVRRSFNPQEIKEIRKQIRANFQQQSNINAKEMSQNYINMINTHQDFQGLSKDMRQDGRRGFKQNDLLHNSLVDARIANGRIENPPAQQ